MNQRFRVGASTIVFARGDITLEHVDAIVNAANSTLLGGGGVDAAIHAAAGPGLLEACRSLRATTLPDGLATGGAVITPGFALRARHVIHCVGPIYRDAGSEAPQLLANCYSQALRIARENSLRSIAFPSISTGAYGYPVNEAAPIAVRTVGDVLGREHTVLLARFVLFDERTLAAYLAAANALWPAAS